MVSVQNAADLAVAHNTTDYPSSLLVLRRGLPVPLSVSTDALELTPISALSLDTEPPADAPPTGPSATLRTDGELDDPDAAYSGWQLTAADAAATLTIPADAPVGLYRLSDPSSAAPALRFVVLFNPFLPADPVHLPDPAARAEYVRAEAGLIWRGSADSFSPAAWDYAQFDPIVLQEALVLLENVQFSDRGDPVAVTRHLSAAVNANDDGGVIVGRWDGDYADGVPPTQWTGSASVLRAFHDAANGTDRTPVRYGQCWVFAGVLASVCRAVGVPCRVTSNFSSAHDTTRPYNRAVDLYFDAAGELLEKRSTDSIWNFHVWCDAWMTRPDLADAAAQLGFACDGWQAIDATPQELSEGLFQMGPAPLPAVKRGYTIDFDTDFVIGEVNADVLYYWQQPGAEEGADDEFVVRNKRTRNVGRFISTKAVGSAGRNDITLDYKFPEGSPEEREALANREKPSDAINPPADAPAEVAFSALRFNPRVRFGDDLSVSVDARNAGEQPLSVRFAGLARATRYTGESVGTVARKTDELTIAPGASASFTLTVDEGMYRSALTVRDAQTVRFDLSARVDGEAGGDGQQTWADQCVVRVYGDDALEVRAPRTLEVGQESAVTVRVRNSFRVALTNVVVRAEGSGVLSPPVARNIGTVEPGQTVEQRIDVRGSQAGERTVVVTLDTDELQDIVKDVKINVREADSMNWFERLFARLGWM